MLKRLCYSIYKPKYIATFMKDKIYIPIIYFILALLISASPLVVKYCVSENNISYTSLYSAVEDIPSTDAKLEDYKFTSTDSFKITIDDVTYVFGTKDLVLSTGTVIVFSETNLIGYSNRTKSFSETYESLGFSDIDFSKIKSSSADYASFQNDLNIIYNKYYRYSNLSYSASLVISEFLDVVLVTLILFVIVTLYAPYLNFSQKFTISVYCLTWYFIFKFIQNVFSISYIEYIGLIISIFCVRRALSSIKVIERPKRK